MNKIQAACVFQTILFTQTNNKGMSKEETIKVNQAEIAQYMKGLNALHIRYQVTDTIIQEDGSIIIKLRKQQDYLTEVKSYFKK